MPPWRSITKPLEPCWHSIANQATTWLGGAGDSEHHRRPIRRLWSLPTANRKASTIGCSLSDASGSDLRAKRWLHDRHLQGGAFPVRGHPTKKRAPELRDNPGSTGSQHSNNTVLYAGVQQLHALVHSIMSVNAWLLLCETRWLRRVSWLSHGRGSGRGARWLRGGCGKRLRYGWRKRPRCGWCILVLCRRTLGTCLSESGEC
eukprot:6646114-Pyramimonas_sp.AAC.2